MRVALDTNILAYAEGVDGPTWQATAFDALEAIQDDELFVPVQVLGELLLVLIRKAGRPAASARHAIAAWSAKTVVLPTTAEVLDEAMAIVERHRLQVWDSVILAAAAQAGCELLLTEDLQDGFAWRGVTVRNPFSGPPP